jgi:hypothetical protein
MALHHRNRSQRAGERRILAIHHRRDWRKIMALRSISLLAAAQFILMTPVPSHALTATTQDCKEAAEFIANAARSRDNGLTSEAFFARFDGDLQLLQSLPPEVRWFVRDEDDEALLRGAAVEVFTSQRTPDEHAGDFLRRCRNAVEGLQTHRTVPAGTGGDT